MTLIPNDTSRRPVVAVVGAGGFLGSSVARALSAKGIEVHGFTSANPAVIDREPHPKLCSADVIFHLATRISPAIAEREPERAKAEVDSFRGLLSALQENPRRPVFVFAASGGTVYDARCTPPYDEQAPVHPTSVYGRTKLAQEEELTLSSGWLVPVALRLSNVYGPGQRTDAGYGVIGHWIEAFLAGEQLRILGDGGSSRDYVHIEDVTRSMLAVLRSEAALRSAAQPTVLNVGAGVPTSLEELLRHFETAVRRPVRVQRELARVFDRKDVWLDVRRAATVLDWRPRIGIADGLYDTWRHHPRVLSSRSPLTQQRYDRG